MTTEYVAVVIDLDDPAGGARYRVKALTPENAVVQAKDAYTGLFGDWEERQKHLVVELTEIPERWA